MKQRSTWKIFLACIVPCATLLGVFQVDARSHGKGARQRFQLPFCDEHVGRVSPEAIQKIRDTHQEWLLNRRIEAEMTELLADMHTQGLSPVNPHNEETWRRDWTREHVAQRLNASAVERHRLEALMAGLVADLRANSTIPATTTVHDLVQCSSGHLNPRLYPDLPEVSLMLQYFRRPAGIPHMVQLLETCDRQLPVELLVNVDSPEEGQTWADLSWSTRGRLVPVFSSNIHEIRAYNRMARLARGKVLVVLQDDDTLQPADCSWLHALAKQFAAMPRLGMVGLKSYRRGNGAVGNVERWPDTFHLFSDPTTGNFFTFPLQVDYAPMALRRSALLNVGGVDETMSDAGECGIMSDWELSIRMWTAGWYVGFMPLVTRGRVDDQEGTTHSPKNVRRCWGRQMHIGGTLYDARWGNGWGAGPGAFLERLENDIRILNLRTLDRNFTTCPFRKGCDDLDGNPAMPEEFKHVFGYRQRPPVDA